MKRILLILSLFCLCFTFNEVNAIRPVDIKNYNFGAKWEELEFSVGGHKPTPENLFSTADGGFVVIFSYRENSNRIPTTYGGIGNAQMEHAKVVKYTKDFQKQWETNLYEIGNWDNADPLAPTVNTNLLEGTELEDGSFIFTGYTGMGLETAVYYRVDKDGKLLYKNLDKEMRYAVIPASLKDGGYVIKYWRYGEATITQTYVVKPGYYYIVYDCNNNVVNSFPEVEEAKLNNYEFDDIQSKEELIYKGVAKHYSKETVSDEKRFFSYNEKYLFTTTTGNRVYSYSSKDTNDVDVKIYDSNGNVKNTILEARAFEKYGILKDESYFIFTDGSYMIGNKVFDVNGNKIFDITNINENYRPDSEEVHEKESYEYGISSTVLCDGTLLRIKITDTFALDEEAESIEYFKIEYKKSISKENDDFANLVIADEEIKMNVGIHLENDRTYISIDNLCSYLGCSHKRAKSDNDMLVIYFPVFDKSNKFFEGEIRYDYKNPSFSDKYSEKLFNYIESAFYVVEHKVETKFYQSYLDITPFTIFGLKSPTYNADSVDVTSKVIDGKVYVPLRFVSEALGRYITYTPGVDGGKPTITISAAGEGEFYEKYGVVVSKDQYNEGDAIANKETTSTIKLREGKLYSYGIDKISNTVINTNQTIFFPLSVVVSGKDYDSFIDRRQELKNNSEYYLGHYSGSVSPGNDYGGLSCKQNYLWREANRAITLSIDYPYLAISSINGYPFMKIVYIDLKK